MATGLYAIYKQPHPPTGIEMCVYCNFMSSREQNLVIAGTSQLHVYRLIGDGESATSKGTDKSDIKSKKQKLECLASYSLFGNITSMQKVRLAGASRDGLLLSFADAKLSLIEYDPSSHDLKNTSLHYFQDESLKDGIEQNLHIPIVRVDTENRCAVMLIYGSRLVVLPFRRDIITEEQSFLTGNKTQIMSSFVIDLRHLDEKITNVIDFQFLHGYYEPTLFILYEPVRTWAGRVAVRKDTCNIVAISLNIPSKVYPIVWSMQNLPFDCIQVLAVQKPIGGVLVLAVNSLFYLNQSVPPYGVSLNSITQHSTDFILKEQQGVKISLDCAQAAFIDTDRLVLSLKGGELYVLTMMVDGMRAVRSFNFDKSAASVLTTCCCACDDNYLFLGSRLGNSLLLKYTQKDDLAPDDVSAPLAKKIKLEKDLDEDKLDDLELEVYGTDNTQPGTEINSYTFEVCDSIMNIGPCGQMVMGEPAFLSEEFSNTKDPDVELVTTSGHGKNGALSVLQRSIRPQVVTTFELPGCTDMWTVIGQPNSDEVSYL
ncbi:unnamed protein product [Owenia fusiformis]|uniref:Cleavage and polyadenylation specificity factor subunit 1 n=1 Tax=Owenia fusiformis TaxID=6347 RepID=A0A8S4NBV4_OWEFU|nr:unnamed protein product [Owenia fusiformis]